MRFLILPTAALACFVSTVALADQEGSCDLTLTGDVKLAHKSKTFRVSPTASYQEQAAAKRVHASVDYWLSDTEMRAQLEPLASIKLGSKKTPATLKEEVDKKMQKDPRLFLVAIGCGDKELGLEVTPTSASKYADIPFKPGRFVIAPDAGAQPAGQFVAQLSLGQYPNATIYRVTQPGTLEFEQFDAKGLRGKIAFTAVSFDKTKTVSVSGAFNYTCIGDRCAK